MRIKGILIRLECECGCEFSISSKTSILEGKCPLCETPVKAESKNYIGVGVADEKKGSES